MRFLILTQYFFPEVGAAQARLAAMARQLVQYGHEVEIVTAFPNYPTGKIFPEYRGRFHSQEVWEGIPIHRSWIYASQGAGVGRLLNYGSFTASSLLTLGRLQKPDWIFVESPPPILAASAFIMSRWFGCPVITNIADPWPDFIREMGMIKNEQVLRAMEILERWVYRHSDYVNAVTEGIRTKLIEEKAVPERKVTFLPNGVDTGSYGPRPPDEELKQSLGLQGKSIILYPGNHGYAQGLETAIAAADLLSSRANIHFLFVGDGSEKQKLVRMARERSLTNVTFCDPVPAAAVPRYLSIATSGLAVQRALPSFDLNRPAKMFAIMASGVPIIFSGQCEGSRIVEQADAGIVVTPEDPATLAEAVSFLVENPARARLMGERGRTFVTTNLTWATVVGNWLQQLNSKSDIDQLSIALSSSFD